MGEALLEEGLQRTREQEMRVCAYPSSLQSKHRGVEGAAGLGFSNFRIYQTREGREHLYRRCEIVYEEGIDEEGWLDAFLFSPEACI